jgi:sarcosine oxidase, subunit beta
VSGERVVIIGGGVTGALCAVRLAERGFVVTVLEKAAIGNGSSSRSAAGIRAQFGVEETVLGMLYSEWWYTHFHDLLCTPAERRQPVIKQNGYLFLFDDPAHPDVTATPDRHELARAAWEWAKVGVLTQQRLGVPVEVLGREEVARRWPHLRADRLVGATWCPTDGFLFPAVIYGEGFRRAEELGATIVQRAEVLGAERRGRTIVAVVTTRGTFAADWFVNCTNAWAPRVSQRLGGMPLPIAPVKRFLYFLRPDKPVMPPEAWERLPMTIYGMGNGLGMHSRPEGALLMLGGTSRSEPEPDFSDEDQDRVPPAFDHRHGIDNFGFTLLRELGTYAPLLAESGGLVATSCGYYAMTPDATPLIGIDQELRNLVHAAGFSGHGVMHAPITALLVEALVTGGVRDGLVPLPAPFSEHHINLRAFDPSRDFARSEREMAAL